MPDSSNVITEIKISELPAATQANADDQLEANQAGTTRRITLDQVATLVQDTIGATDGVVSVGDYGAIGDGVTDDTAALQAAIDACAAAGGGHVNCTGGRWLIDSADLVMKSNVFLVGPWLMAGYATSQRNYTTVKGSLVINPLYTIKFAAYDTFYLPFNSGLKGLIILKKGMGYPTTLRAAYDLAQTFSGTAITNTGTTDVWLSNLLIIGFEYGIRSNSGGRSRIEYVNGDNTNGIYIAGSADIQHMTGCHMWAYATAHVGNPKDYNVVSIADAAGLIRLTVEPLDSAGSPNILKTGDRVVVASGTGSNSRAPWIITVITPYNPLSPTDNVVFDLQGSTFVGPYTAGGNVWIDGYYRSGIAYNFDTGCEWAEATDCFSFGYAIGFRLNDCYPATLINCGTDGSGQTDDVTSLGYLVTGATQSMASLIGCKAAGTGLGYKIDVFPANSDIVMLDGCRSWAIGDTDFWFARGAATLVNCAILSSGPKIKIDDLASNITLIGGDFTNLPAITYESAASPRPAFVAVRGQADTDILIGLKPAVPFIGIGVSIRPALQVASSITGDDPSISVQRYSTSLHGPMLNLSKSQTGGLPGTQGLVGSGEVLGYLVWNGSDGTKFVEAAHIRAVVDGTPGVNDMPTRLEFRVSPDGAATPVEAMRVVSTGSLQVGGASTVPAKITMRGAGQATGAVDTTATLGATLYLQDTGNLAGNGGMLLFGASQGAFATVKGHILSGATNTTGDVVISTRRLPADATLTETLRIGSLGSVTVNGSTAIAAGVNTQAFIKASSTANLGIYYGTGAPTGMSAAKGSLYTNTTATTTTTRLYVNTDGGTTWTNLTTAA